MLTMVRVTDNMTEFGDGRESECRVTRRANNNPLSGLLNKEVASGALT